MITIGRRELLSAGGASLFLAACHRGSRARPPGAKPPASDPAAPPSKTAGPSFHNFSCDVSANGQWLAIGGGPPTDGEGAPIAIWDLARQRILRHRMIDDGLGLALAGDGLLRFSPSTKRLIANTMTNAITIFDATGDALAAVGQVVVDETRDSAPRSAVLPGERELFTVGEKGLAVVPLTGDHDAHSPDVRWLGLDDFPTETGLAARADGLAVGVHDTISAVEVSTGKVRYSVPTPWGNGEQVAFSPDATIVAGASDHTVAFVETATGQTLGAHAGTADFVDSVVWSANGKRAAVVRRLREVAIFDGVSPSCTIPARVRVRPLVMATDLASFAFSPDGSRGVVATEDGEVAGYDLGATARERFRTEVVTDPREWCGVYWPTADRILAITSRELVFVDAARGAVAAREPIGFAFDRDVGV